MEVKQAANVLALVEFFAARKRAATLSDISKHFNWPRSSTFKLLGTLAAHGYLYEPHGRGGYYPSPKWTAVLKEVEYAQPLPSQFGALLDSLSQQTGETAVLAAISGHHAIFIAAAESSQAVRYTAPVGKMVPIQATATGRALLSQLSEASRAALLRKISFEKYTASTLMAPEQVEEQIAISLKRGWFEGQGEYTADLGGISIPLSFQQRPLAVMVSGPRYRIEPHYVEIARIMRKEIRAAMTSLGQ